jgi:hypothetical protein
MTITWHDVLAALIGAGFTLLGMWGAAVADRIRYRRLEREATKRDDTGAKRKSARRTASARQPRSSGRATHVHDEVAAWLESMGIEPELAAAAAARARTANPGGTFETKVAAALKHCQEN